MSAAAAVMAGWGRRFPGCVSARSIAGARVAVALAAIGVAYHYSLVSLIRNLGLDSPLAYLGLVPFIALALAFARRRAIGIEPDIHDRHLDYIVGIPLLATAFGIMVLLPIRMSNQFWTWRMDLLSLPLFVAGTVALAFGVRALWRIRAAVAFLFLAWPVPYTTVVDRWLERFTDLTVAAVRGLLGVVHVADPIDGGDRSLFAVVHDGERFVVSVASACSGANGIVGFLLVGAAFGSIIRGKRLPKTLWLLAGMAILWATNLIRILLVFWVGQNWGEQAAIDGFHPYIGLVLFSLGVLAMIVSMPLFGLRFRWRTPSSAAPAPPPAQASGARDNTRRPAAVPRARLSLSIILLVGAVLATSDAGLRQFDLVSDNLGAPRLASFSSVQGRPPGWDVSHTDTFDWARRFFGGDSTWLRFTYRAGDKTSALRSSAPLFADVISSGSLRNFSVYGLEACYTFHGYKIQDARSVDVGGGIAANVISYYHPKLKRDWTTLYWHWPVRSGKETRYERVVLMMYNTMDAELKAPPDRPSLARRIGLSLDNAARDRKSGEMDKRLDQTRRFLVAFAQSVVQDHAGLSAAAPARRGG